MTTALDEPHLARVGATENFAVSGLLGPRLLRQELGAVYAYARTVDDLGDEFSGDRMRALGSIADDLDRLFGGRPGDVRHAAVRGLAPVVARHDLPREPFDHLLAANHRDQRQRSYPTWDDLRDYCRLSAEPVGRIVLGILGAATPDRVAASDDVCTALQVIEHCQDVAEDQRRGRTYLPEEDLERFRCQPVDLARVPTPTHVRGLVAFELDRAERLLDAGAVLVRDLSGWGRMLVAGYVAGGRAAISALRRSKFRRLDGSCRPARSQRLALTIHTAVRRH